MEERLQAPAPVRVERSQAQGEAAEAEAEVEQLRLETQRLGPADLCSGPLEVQVAGEATTKYNQRNAERS